MATTKKQQKSQASDEILEKETVESADLETAEAKEAPPAPKPAAPVIPPAPPKAVATEPAPVPGPFGACPACGNVAVSLAGGMRRCSQCGHSW